ncbi:MAG TPA: transglutaminase domain-containing protein [Pirellulales bacterium]|nr:transglutaminase domain-containing protein [Pirellulales bacterium]
MFGTTRKRRRFACQGSRRLCRLTRLVGYAEVLEPRLMLSSTPALVVGRTLSSYFAGDVQNQQETLTFTVYNQQADPIAGVSLTDTLESGVTFSSASIVPNQSGQNLAWSLGTINGFESASVTVIVSLANSIPLQLDTGAQASGTLDAAAVSNSTPAATLRSGSLADPALLASTLDANTTDPYIQEEAAALNYDPQQIFNFLQTNIGYESYVGSLRGARGTLWSNAGDSLDVASLGVALMRASGIPAEYVHGTLSEPLSQQLILSMFPAPLRVFGYVAPGVEKADPANDPQLLAETQDHYWMQFDAGSGFQAADTLFSQAVVGQTFCTSDQTFTEVPEALRHQVTISLVRELTTPGSGALTGGGSSQDDATVLEEHFDSVELVGASLTLGQYVDSNSVSAGFSYTTYTYTPYLLVNERDGNLSDDPLGIGTSYQEIITNFPFGSQILTGLFLEIQTSDPLIGGGTQTETQDKTLLDRIGYVARQNGGSGATISVQPNQGPAWTDQDFVTVDFSGWRLSEQPLDAQMNALQELGSEVDALPADINDLPQDSPELQSALQLTEQFGMQATSAFAGEQIYKSGQAADFMASTYLTRVYPDTLSFVAVTQMENIDPDTGDSTISRSIDILRYSERTLASPLQAKSAEDAIRFINGIGAKVVEDGFFDSSDPSEAGISSLGVLTQALSQSGASLVPITSQNISDLTALNLPAEATDRIESSAQEGNLILTPNMPVSINGEDRIAWIEIDGATGDTTVVLDDGTHGVEEPKDLPIVPQLRTLFGKIGQGQDVDRALLQLQNAKTRQQKQVALEALELIINDCGPLLETSLKLLTESRYLVQVEEIVFKARTTLANTHGFAKVNLAKDPAIGDQLYSPASESPEFADLGTHGETGLAVDVEPDPLFTVPDNGAFLDTVYKIGIKNLTGTDGWFQINLTDLAPGVDVISSVPELYIPAGAVGETSIFLEPTGALPAPGTSLPFDVGVSSVADPSVTASLDESVPMPSVEAATFSLSDVSPSTAPGQSVQTQLTINSVGNAPANVTFDVSTPAGIAISGLTSATINPGDSITQALTISPAAGLALNTDYNIVITPQVGQTVLDPFTIVVHLAAPGADSAESAATIAGQLGDTPLGLRLEDLSEALTNLAQTPTSAVFNSQALAALDAIIGLLPPDPFLAPLVPALTADRTALAQATTAATVQSATLQLGNDLTTLANTLADEAAHGFTLALVTTSQVGQPQQPVKYQINLQNTGSQTTTYDLSVAGLPSGVTGVFSQQSVTLNSGQATPTSGPSILTLTITSTSTTAISPFSFTVTATAEGAAEITRSVTGSFTVPPALVEVTSVTPSPAFAQAGDMVDVKAGILNAVNQQQKAKVYFTVTDSGNNVLFTSTPVTTTLNVLTTLSTVDLGNLDTTGFAQGDDTITVTVTDTSGNPIPGATGTGTLLIGSPVTASESVSSSTLPPGTSTITNTLQIDSTVNIAPPLTLVGQLPDSDPHSTNSFSGGVLDGVTVNGNVVYVFGSGGLYTVSTSDVTAPTLLATQSDFPQTGGAVVGSQLIAVDAGTPTSIAVDNNSSLTDYDLGGVFGTAQDPGRDDTIFPNYQLLSNFVVSPDGKHLYATYNQVVFDTSTNTITAQNGTVISFDISTPSALSAPSTNAILYNTNGTNSQSPLFQNGGNFNMFGIVQPNANTLLVGSTSSTGSATQTGEGELLSIDVSDPDNINSDAPNTSKVVNTLDIPGTTLVQGIATNGDTAFVLASQGGWLTPFTSESDIGPTGDIVMATVDISNPRDPTVLHTQTLGRSARGMTQPVSLGNGLFAFASLGETTDTPQLIVVDASDPTNIKVVEKLDLPGQIRGLATDGTYLYATGDDGLLIYKLGGTGAIPVHISVNVPNAGVSIVPNSFSVTPTSITPGATYTTIVWDTTLTPSSSSETITWQSTVTGLQPGQALAVAQDGMVSFTSDGTAGTVTLPDQFVTADQIIGLTPTTQTVAPGAAASYEVNLANPTSQAVTYTLSVQGVTTSWVNLTSTVMVAANSSTNVALTLTSDSFAAAEDYGFSVTAAGNNGAMSSVQGDLMLQGAPQPPDPNSHGLVVALTPAQATVGRGTSATYTVQLTNTGNADDTFALSVTGLPIGVTAAFAQNSVDVPAGAGNFRDVTLTLTAATNLAAQAYAFQVKGTSTTDSSITSSAGGTLTVVTRGVHVTLSPGAGAPGTTFQMTVTNTGTASDTFNLSLAGPAALVSALASTSITLAAGASRTVNITTPAVNFADAGNLLLTAEATSAANAAVTSSATSNLTIAASQGLSAAFQPASQTLLTPGTANFFLNVNNIGNTLDSYSATIVGSSGPVTAMLMGLDGQPTQSIPTFFLPGLGQGVLELMTDSITLGHGTVQVKITSLTNPSDSVTVQANVNVGNPNDVGDVGLLLLDSSGSGALTNSGNGGVHVTGGDIVINSKSSKAGIETGNGNISATEIDVTGKLSQSGRGKYQGVIAHPAPLVDPLAALVAPTPPTPVHKAVNVSGKTQLTLSPGTYSGGIKISGSAVVTLLPGVYYLQGGGLSISGSAKLNGQGVTIYNAPKKSTDSIAIAPNATVTLSAPTDGTYQGIVIFQNRTSTAPIVISGGTFNLTGIVYAPKAKLYFAGNKNLTISGDSADDLSGALILADLITSANGAINIGSDSSASPQLVVAAVPLASSLNSTPTNSPATSTTTQSVGSSATTGIVYLPPETFNSSSSASKSLLLDGSNSNFELLDELLSQLAGGPVLNL